MVEGRRHPYAGAMEVGRPSDLREVVQWSAAMLSATIRERAVTCVEVMSAFLDHIDIINPQVNAIVSLRPRDELLAEAAEKDRLLTTGTHQGWMHGFPHAVKDLADVDGMRTTCGFAPWADGPAAATDSLFVRRLRDSGAIFIGKTNTPEFGLGSHTYNPVFGTTFNAYDQTRSAGGSSGGAAVAVALRLVPVADGSDFMGSLRNPAGWNNVFGLRPTVGRIPAESDEVFVNLGGVDGPIARTALDLALLLQTMAGPDPTFPLSLDDDPADLTSFDASRTSGRRVAWLGDLGGYLPMERDVLDVTTSALEHLRALDVSVTTLDELPTHGDFKGNASLWPTWLAYRQWLVGSSLEPIYRDAALRPSLKSEAVFEVEALIGGTDGHRAMTALDVYAASKRRSGLFQAFRELFEEFDYVMLPTAQVLPFDAGSTWPRAINGVPMSTYHRWMEVTTIGTLINSPTLAMPAGFSANGLPIGLQVIGRHRGERELLDLAAAWERQTHFVELYRPGLLG